MFIIAFIGYSNCTGKNRTIELATRGLTELIKSLAKTEYKAVDENSN